MRQNILFNRRQILQTVCGSLGLILLGAGTNASYSYTPSAVNDPARLSGIIRYAGHVPRPKKLKLSGDSADCRQYPMVSEEMIQSSGGGLRHVVVSLEGITRGKKIPSNFPEMAEIRCTFVPHVLSITTGTKLILHNQDSVLNTFHAIEHTSGSTLFNIGMPNKDQKVYRKIKQHGLIKVLCDVHPWEVAYILAFPHPYHTVTNAAGEFILEEIPPGTYVLTLWHEKLGIRKQQIVIKPHAQERIELIYPARKD